jgi:hypothetical protein
MDVELLFRHFVRITKVKGHDIQSFPGFEVKANVIAFMLKTNICVKNTQLKKNVMGMRYYSSKAYNDNTTRIFLFAYKHTAKITLTKEKKRFVAGALFL